MDGPPDNLLDAARFYRERHGWAVHPLHGPNEGSEKERGKKPKLAGYKIPKRIEFRTELARTATGKLQKFKLRGPYWEGYEKQVN